ncbi:spermatogenesis-associated protein 6 [Pelodytes ibericus]
MVDVIETIHKDQPWNPVPFRRSSSSTAAKNYERPTIASKSRSPSPYTKRRMCEMSEDARQRLAHLNLGPYEFKKETESKPPFVVRHMETFSIAPDTTFTLQSPKGSVRGEEWSRLHNDPSLLGSYTPVYSKINRKQHTDDLEDTLNSLNDHLLTEPASKMSPFSRFSLSHTVPSSRQRRPPSPVLSRSSLRERFHSAERTSANWEEIHERVESMLKTHSARQRLHFDKSVSGKDHYRDSLDDDSLCVSDLQTSRPLDKSVHLDNGEFWSNKAAAYKGKTHREVFAESMEKIYKNMYRNASDPNVYRKSHYS